jgi:hypothetical protein
MAVPQNYSKGLRLLGTHYISNSCYQVQPSPVGTRRQKKCVTNQCLFAHSQSVGRRFESYTAHHFQRLTSGCIPITRFTSHSGHMVHIDGVTFSKQVRLIAAVVSNRLPRKHSLYSWGDLAFAGSTALPLHNQRQREMASATTTDWVGTVNEPPSRTRGSSGSLTRTTVQLESDVPGISKQTGCDAALNMIRSSGRCAAPGGMPGVEKHAARNLLSVRCQW